jgi:CheY-like chemotaxis protein
VNEQNDETPSVILVVDDSSFLRKRIRQVLQNDYSLVEANSGVTALVELDKQEFLCILTDLVMPEMDGFGLLTEIKKRQLKTPVIVLTADIRKSTREQCESLGAAAFVQKPVNADSLRAALSTVLAKRGQLCT